MFIDTNLVFCDNEDVSAAAGTEVIASAIDLGAGGASVIGSDMHLVITVSTAFASGGSATVTFRLVSDSTGSSMDANAQRKLNVLQVCDHLGWESSRMHGVKRLFAWMIPGEARVYPLGELDAAKAWVSSV